MRHGSAEMDPSQFQRPLPAANGDPEPAELNSSSSISTSFTSASTSSNTVSSFTSVSSITLSSFPSVSSTLSESTCICQPAFSSTLNPKAGCGSTSTPPTCTTSSPVTPDPCWADAGGAGQFTPRTSSQGSKSNRSSRGPICRICHEGDGVSELISPCWCAGSIGAVHKACLERWLTLSSCDSCELCGYTFPVTRSPKPFWKYLLRCDNPGIRRALLIDGICLLVLTPLAVVSIYLCMMGAFYYANNERGSSDALINQLLILANVTYQEGTDAPGSEESVTIIPGRLLRHKRLNESAVGKDSSHWKVLGLVMLAMVLLALYSAWAAIVYGYHSRVWRQWQVIHQDLTLADSGRRPHTLCQDLRSSFSVVSLQSFGDLPDQQHTEGAVTPSVGVLDCAGSPEDMTRLGQDSLPAKKPAELDGQE